MMGRRCLRSTTLDQPWRAQITPATRPLIRLSFGEGQEVHEESAIDVGARRWR